MVKFDSFIKQLWNVDGQTRGRLFERVCQWYLLHDPAYSKRISNVWLWNDWPGRWGPEAGIDLVAKTRSGELWAIQAKAYDPAYRVTKSDVDRFLSESARRQFSYRLLISTTNLIVGHALRVIKAQEKPVGVITRADLEQAAVEWPRSAKRLKAKPPKPKTARPHQRQAIKRVIKGFDKSPQGQLIMACGTGKTLIGVRLAEKLNAKRILVLVPTLTLLSKTLRDWCVDAKRDFDFLPVCSDPTVTSSDDWVSSVSELGLPPTTDPTQIASFLRGRGNRVVFSTYHSSPQVASAMTQGRVPGFDIVIADEAHRCAGPVSSDFATILDRNAIKAHHRLFMTATPRIFTGRIKKAAADTDYEVASMDDEDKFGPVFHELKFSEAIKQNLLTDYQVAIVGVDDTTFRHYADHGTFVTTDGKTVTDARQLASHIAVAKSMRRYDMSRVLSFHNRVEGARGFSKLFPEVVAWMPKRERPKGKLWSAYVSGKMPTGRRQNLLSHLRLLDEGERGLLANARCLAEGVDVPTLDSVVFYDPRRSEIDIVQAVGRAIRKADNKRIGTIVLPVFIDPSEEPEIALDASAFEPVWKVLKALRAHDDMLAEELDSLRRELGLRGHIGGRKPSKIHFDLPVRVGADFVRALTLRIVETSTASWEFYFGLLQHFAKREKHARVPVEYIEDGSKLGEWAAVQRRFYKKSKLSPDRVQALETVKGWVWSPYEADWQAGLDHLKHFVKREKHARVPGRYIENGFPLGGWVSQQRVKRNKLSPDRVQALESVKGWVWDSLEADWHRGLNLLKRYVRREKHARVPSGYMEDGFKLRQWVVIQRGSYKKNELSPDRVQALESVKGWVWDTLEADWHRRLNLLKKYVRREKHARVLKGHIEQGFKLGDWVSNQRASYKNETLSVDCIQALESVEGWAWDALEAKWENGYYYLQNFVKREGHAKVAPKHVEEDFNLGNWVGTQRSWYKSENYELSDDRIKALESIKGWAWAPDEAAWQVWFNRLERYVKREGNARVKTNHIECGHKLGKWVDRQRVAYREINLSPDRIQADRIQALESVKGWVWHPHVSRWQVGLDHLKRFVKREKHARVPGRYIESGFPLGGWVSKQRVKRNKLSPDRVQALESVKGWVWDDLEAKWQEGFDYLKCFVRREKHARVPSDYIEDGFKLGSWVSVQRRFYKEKPLAPARIQALESVKGWVWDTR